MIVSEPFTKLPDDSTAVWRYIALVQLVPMLNKKSMFFTNVARLAHQDKWEGFLPSKIMKNIIEGERTESERETVQEIVKNIKEVEGALEVVRSNIGASCWHMNPNESMAMWRLYSERSGSIVVKSTIGCLKSSLEKSPDEIRIRPIEYIDVESEPDVAKVLCAHGDFTCFKHTSFAHERELRATVHLGKFPLTEPGNLPGKDVLCDMDTLIEEILVAPGSEPWFREAVETVARALGCGAPVKTSSLD